MQSEETLSPLKRAILELRDLRTKLEEAERREREPIAIVGCAMRLPGGVTDEESLWRLLAGGVDAIGAVPADRWDSSAYYDPDPDKPGKMNTCEGAFLDDVASFDAEFFGVSPREATSMDPQHRLLLETAWEALENAGIDPSSIAGSAAGVFIGCGNSDYGRIVFADERRIDAYAALGSSFSVAAGRIAYFLGTHGPALTIDTACSASLVAVHSASQSLRSGESTLALVGGVNLILSPEAHINFTKSRMLSPTGRCRTFDAAADGYVRGEGCGVVVLKTLQHAHEDGDRILAIIRGSAVNQDGRSGGLTAPNGPAQEAVIRAALRAAGVAPRQIGYLEAHGTGTPLGDPIEVRAAACVLGEGRGSAPKLWIGSVKTNIGHLEAAAGIAGLLKTVVALRKGKIPAHLHLERKSPHIDWSTLAIDVPMSTVAWQPIDGRRIAGVSSFGFSGTNAHLVVEEAPAALPRATDEMRRPRHVLAISGRDALALRTRAADLAEHLAADPSADLADVCFTANAGRAHLPERVAVEAVDRQALVAALGDIANGEQDVSKSGTAFGAAPSIAFLFTGQGSQYAGMARSLYETSPIFKESLDRCAELLRESLDRPLLEVLHSTDAGLLSQTRYTQPALFALEYALAETWQAWGVRPTFVMGHSVGEYVAACVAGAIALPDALRLIAARAGLMQALPAGGRMVAVLAGRDSVAERVRAYGRVAIAAVNGPQAVVISGESRDLDRLVKELGADGIVCKDLAVSHAFHSPLVEPMLSSLQHEAAKVPVAEPRIAMVSNVTGGFLDLATLVGRDYWSRHTREPVQFEAGIRTLEREGTTIFLEVGPAPVLLGMARQFANAPGRKWLASLRADRDDWQQLAETLAELYASGVDVDWGGFDRGYTRRRLALPTYPFQRRRYWFEKTAGRADSDPEQTWLAVKAAGAHQSAQAPLGVHAESYAAKWRSLEDLTVARSAATLSALGAFARPGDAHDVDSLIERCGAAPAHRRLLQRWLDRLAAKGLLRRTDGRFVADAPLDGRGLAERVAEADGLLADDPHLLAYLRNCGAKLTDVIAGRASPLETLFPGGSSAIAEGLYEGANANRYANEIAAAVVAAAAQGAGRGRPLRVLEIGAGTGGTTGFVLGQLGHLAYDYLFTDVSDMFLGRARHKFARHSAIRFGVFDLEKAPAEQGYEPQSFDVIIGANVVHAARDLDAALKRIAALLTPGGFLTLVEATEPHAWFDVSTGLIEGWQHFADDLRGESPLLKPEQWRAALLPRGFIEVAAFPDASSPAAVFGQHVLIARTPPDAALVVTAISASARSETASIGRADVVQVAPPTEADARKLRIELSAANADERLDLLADFVRDRVMEVLGLAPDQRPDRRQRLMDLGLDSLMAIQLRDRLEAGLALRGAVPATLMFDYPTIVAVAAFLAKQISGPTEAATPAPAEAAQEQIAARSREIAAMSEDEAAALLFQRLEQ